MDFEQIQQTLRALAQMQSKTFESLKLHSEMLSGIIPALDVLKTSALRHDKEIAEIRLIQLESSEKLNALITTVDGIIRGGSR